MHKSTIAAASSNLIAVNAIIIGEKPEEGLKRNSIQFHCITT